MAKEGYGTRYLRPQETMAREGLGPCSRGTHCLRPLETLAREAPGTHCLRPLETLAREGWGPGFHDIRGDHDLHYVCASRGCRSGTLFGRLSLSLPGPILALARGVNQDMLSEMDTPPPDLAHSVGSWL